jgi:AraC family transcriptional regulator
MRMQGNLRRRRPPTRGTLAVWQQRVVATYIEEHLALHVLAKLVHLSAYYFCRAFKQSFGIPPHRYHINRRIDRAKTLLANPGPSVTDIALELGFSETSSFSAAFRHTTGTTPISSGVLPRTRPSRVTEVSTEIRRNLRAVSSARCS